MFTHSMISQMQALVGKTFAHNFSNTGSSLCLAINLETGKVFYQECYSQYANFTGKNAKGEVRTDKVSDPRPGLKTMSLYEFYSAAIGWV